MDDAATLEELKAFFQEEGVSALSDEHLIALIIRKGDATKNVLELSRAVLKRAGGKARDLGDITYEELMEKNKGMTDIKAMQLVCALELGRRTLIHKEIRGVITSPEDMVVMVQMEMGELRKECFRAAFLNTKGMLIGISDISVGTLNASLVHAREIFYQAIKKNAASVILLHNHPSGDARPSEEDRQMTAQIVKAGDILGIKVFDHIIIAKNEYYSFKEENEL